MMLTNLEITNFGLIDRLELEFKPGLTVFTGETGAGKTIIINALQVALGGRAYGEYIKSGEDKAVVQAVFETGSLYDIKKKLAANGFEDEDDVLILTRQLSRSGRNICRINGQITTLQLYKQIGEYLMDMHIQHEQQSLLNKSTHRELLDRFGGSNLLELKNKTAELFVKWKSVAKELEHIQEYSKARMRQADILRFQIDEIKSFSLAEDEEEQLLFERKLLVNAEKIMHYVQSTHKSLYSTEDDFLAAVDLLGQAMDSLEQLSNIDSSVKPLYETIASAFYQVQDVSMELVNYRDNVEFHPERLEEIEYRLNEISKLKSKYGDSVGEILDFMNKAEKQLEEIMNTETKEQDLKIKKEELKNKYNEAAAELSRIRHEVSLKLKIELEAVLKELEMQDVKIEIKMEDCEPCQHGTEDIEFLLSVNKGEPPRSIAKIASGGELSRIILAFKTVLAVVDYIPSLVFDEVDTGIGGKTLIAVAKKLKHLSEHRQILVVTHAAPIAALAENHYFVHKQTINGKTYSRIKELFGEHKIVEIARMLGGRKSSKAVLEHAKQLINLN